MHPLAIALAIASAGIHAWRELLTKKAHDKQVFVWWYEVFALLFFFPVAAYFAWESTISLTGMALAMGTGIIHFFYWIFLSKSYEHGDLSHVYPIIRSSPGLVLILSVVFLREQVSAMGVLGVLVILLGIYILNMKEGSLRSLLEPFRSFEQKATKYALLTSVTVALYSIVDKVGVSHVHPMLFVYLLTISSMLLFTPYVFSLKTKETVWNEWRRNKKTIMANGFFVMFGYALALMALTIERVSYVTALRQLSIVFGVLLGGHVLLEKHRRIRLLGAGVIFVGAMLISFAR
jgi:uncharacterized membrane protein